MKRIISFALALIFIFSAVAVSVSAEENDEKVARMWFCSEECDITPWGHVFLYFENLTDEPIMVGRYEVPAHGDVSVGCFGEEGPRGEGVYYNLETELKHYSSLKGIYVDLDEKELAKVTKKIRKNRGWSALNNCYQFASSGWNAGPAASIPYLIFPKFARIMIFLRGAKSLPVDIDSRNVTVYKQSEL